MAPGGVDTAIWAPAAFFRQLVGQHTGDRASALFTMASTDTPLGRQEGAGEIAGQAGFLLSAAA